MVMQSGSTGLEQSAHWTSRIAFLLASVGFAVVSATFGGFWVQRRERWRRVHLRAGGVVSVLCICHRRHPFSWPSCS